MKNQRSMYKTTCIVKYKPRTNHTMKNEGYLYRHLDSSHFKHEVPLLALNEYKPDSHGEDEFSRKQAWFYTYGDEEAKEEFKEQFVDIITTYFEDDDVEWDMMTIYPTHSEGEVNPNLRDLMMEVASETGISLEQVLHRSQTVRESHELDDEKAKVINLEGSIDVDRDLEGKNVIIVDNISLSGTSLLHGANRLKQKGAEKVFALTIGTENREEATKPEENQKASQLL